MKRLLIIFTAFAWGCASSDAPVAHFDTATGRSTFRSPKVIVGNVSMSTGLAGGQRIMMQAFADCEGRGCTPSAVEIAFFNDSSSDLNIDYRRIELSMDGRTLQWEDEGRLTEPAHFIVPRGEFIRVPLSKADFDWMVDASEVTVSFGLTGTSEVRMPHSRRQPLRQLADAYE